MPPRGRPGGKPLRPPCGRPPPLPGEARGRRATGPVRRGGFQTRPLSPAPAVGGGPAENLDLRPAGGHLPFQGRQEAGWPAAGARCASRRAGACPRRRLRGFLHTGIGRQAWESAGRCWALYRKRGYRAMNHINVMIGAIICLFSLVPSCVLPARTSSGYHSDKSSVPEYSISTQIYEKSAEGQRIHIRYPQVEGLRHISVEEQINRLLYDTGVNIYLDYWNNSMLTVDGSFEVKYQSDTCLSILFQGEPYVQGSAHPTKVTFAVTVDMTTGNEIPLEQIIGDMDMLKDNFTPDYFCMVSGIDSIESGDTFTQRIDSYLHSPVLYDDQEHYHDYYITENALGIIVSVPHVIGDIAIYESNFKYDESAQTIHLVPRST